MPRRPPLALLAVALAAACSSESSPKGPVRLDAPATGAAAEVCATVVAELPLTLAGTPRRLTSPSPTTTAAWGDPPITLVCGVAEGSARDDPYEFDGVRWAMHDIGAARTWTTRGRAVNVVVTVPDAYSGQAELLAGLTGALTPTA